MGTLEQCEKTVSQEICPSCRHDATKACYVYRHEGGESFIIRCDCCGMMFCRPLAVGELEARRMDSVDDAELFNSSLLKSLHEKLIVGREIRRVRSLLGRNDFSLLDIGCGTGWVSRIW